MLYLRVKQFLTIARLTGLEAIRQPLAFILFATAVLLVALLPLVLSHTLGESVKFVRDGSLGFMFVAGLLLSAQAACSALSEELRRGTASVVLIKPIPRSLFFLAKFAGVAWVMLLYCAGMTMAILLAVRTAYDAYVPDWWSATPLLAATIGAFLIGGLINFMGRRPFVSNAFLWLLILLSAAFAFGGWIDASGARMPFGTLYEYRILPVAALMTLAILMLAGISVALATRLTALPTLSLCGAVFLLGLLSDYFFGRHADTSFIAQLLYQLIPNWQHFWVVDALGGDGVVPLEYLKLALGYAAFYLAGVLTVGAVSFERMEVEGS